MPIVELRESLGSFDVEMENDQDRVKMLTKRINLKEGNHERNMQRKQDFCEILLDFYRILNSCREFMRLLLLHTN